MIMQTKLDLTSKSPAEKGKWIRDNFNPVVHNSLAQNKWNKTADEKFDQIFKAILEQNQLIKILVK
jgi:hypothetical protein